MHTGTAQPGATFAWDFGDGAVSNVGPATLYTYDEPGTYTVTLTVIDATGTDATSVTVTV